MGLFSKKPATPALESVLPLLVNDEWIASADVIPDAAQRPVYIPVGEKWGVSFAQDADGSYSIINRQTAVDAGYDDTALLKAATEQLASIARAGLQASGEGRYRLELPGNEDLSASLILIMPLLLPSLPISGRPVIAIGHRIMLHVCGSDDADGVAGLRELAQSLYSSGEAKPVTPLLYTLVDGVITPFD